MKNVILILLKLLSYLPFISTLFKYIYKDALKTLKEKYLNHSDIVDIILTSQESSKSFRYGVSDYNILIIVSNSCHPKKTLTEIRSYILSKKVLSFVFNSTYIPILSKNEFSAQTIKSYLIRKIPHEKLNWKSIFTNETYEFELNKQDHFAITHNAIQSIDYFLLKEHRPVLNRNNFKNISQSLKVLNSLHPESFKSTSSLIRISKILQRFFYFKVFYKNSFIKHTWNTLTSELIKIEQKGSFKSIPLPEKLKSYLFEVLDYHVIDDITITPTLIQLKKKSYIGKIFIDLHFNSNITEHSYYKKLEKLKDSIKAYESKEVKLRIRFTTNSLYKLQNEKALYPFPLEGLFRKHKTLSLHNYEYNFDYDYDHLIMSSIHFLTAQFMRFRSLKQQTALIGSKFIKSLNLMYKYHLIYEFLKGNDFKVESDEKKIRELFTPQFSNINLDDELTEKDWILVKAQLQYLLKAIREELIKYDPSLEHLRF